MIDESYSYNWGITLYKVCDIIKMIENDELILRPEYQRRSVWPNASKSSFIESMILNVPIPLFLINKNTDGKLEVVDGQQRLSAVYTFLKDGFKFTKLDKLNDFKDHTFSTLASSIKDQINNHQLIFAVVDDASEEQIIDMYYRSNKFTVNLNPQELRYAYYKNSDFKDLVVSITEGAEDTEGLVEFFLQSGILTETNVTRMADLEFTSDLLALILYESLHDKKKVLDKIYSDYEVMDSALKTSCLSQIQVTIDIIKEIFSNKIFSNGQLSAEKSLSLTRFKQKNDFYSLFYVLLQFIKYYPSKHDLLLNDEFAYFLKMMDDFVSPEADIDIFSKYAIKCVSQANTKKSREYRAKFIIEGMSHIFDLPLSNNIKSLDSDIFVINQLEEQVNSLFNEFEFPHTVDFQITSFQELHSLMNNFYSGE